MNKKAQVRDYFPGESSDSLSKVISSLPELSTFADIGKLIRRSSEYIRVRLAGDVNCYKEGNQYLVPKATAARFIREMVTGEKTE